ncbi:ribonuclease HI [Patescibacteria group bacterium]|nr:ribonuclease HI [Patescibacteria group bacterium]
MNSHSSKIAIYTDGSCLNNPGRGGYGAIIRQMNTKGALGDEIVLRGGEAVTTNNRMEMKAILEAVKWCNNNVKDEIVDIYSDSSYVLNSITQGWKKKANIELWAELDAELGKIMKAGIKINWNWVKGHAGNEINERVDKIAVEESYKQKETDVKPIKGENGKGKYNCKKCGKNVNGVLSFMPDSKMIRVDCSNCGNYIMFAEKTNENLKLALERILISKAQLEKIIEIKKNRGENLTEANIKKIKLLKKDEADGFIASEQTLF